MKDASIPFHSGFLSRNEQSSERGGDSSPESQPHQRARSPPFRMSQLQGEGINKDDEDNDTKGEAEKFDVTQKKGDESTAPNISGLLYNNTTRQDANLCQRRRKGYNARSGEIFSLGRRCYMVARMHGARQ